MNATLPERLTDRGYTIGDMQVGEVAWTVPWAMWADSDEQLWIEADYLAENRAHGTADMRVRRDENGVSVWPTAGHRYRPTADKHAPSLPVVSLLDGDTR